MKKILSVLVVILALFQLQSGGHLDGLFGESSSSSQSSSTQSRLSPQELELQQTLALIRSNGPFPYQRDGIVFENRERLLPIKSRGYDREYTVDTPGLSHRGPRRVVTGGNPPEVYYYTEDHYRSFVRIQGH